jgi:nucleoid DNA-binding protein
MKATDKEKKILFLIVLGMTRKELIDSIAASAKLTKADAGRALDATIESIHKILSKKLKVVFGGKGQRKLKTVFGGKAK